MPSIDQLDTVGRIAAQVPGATAVFYDLGIDFCCRGGNTLAEACAARGIDPSVVAGRIAAEGDGPAPAWDTLPLAAVVAHILHRWHAPLRVDLERALAWSEKVVRVHGPRTTAPVVELDAELRALAEELEAHMHKEERVLFPLIEAGHGARAGGPVQVMRLEHDEAGDRLDRIRGLATEFVAPPEACATWRALYETLAKIDRDLREHVHVENNVLFPRALAGAR